MAGIPGKHIYELEELKLLKDDATFAISQDNLTRKVNLRDLRVSFNGDTDEPSEDTYYSTQYLEQKFSGVNDKFIEFLNLIQSTNKNIDELKTYVDTQDMGLSESIGKLKTYVDTQDTQLSESIGKLKTYVDTQDTQLSESIGKLSTRITNLENKIKNISKITIGNTIPTSLAEGEIYFQYF